MKISEAGMAAARCTDRGGASGHLVKLFVNSNVEALGSHMLHGITAGITLRK